MCFWMKRSRNYRRRTLDVGCGTGEYIRRANELGFTASGLEPADAMRAAAFNKNPGATIVSGVATELPFPDESFDLVICIEVLRYLDRSDIRQALRQIHRVLRPGGTMFLTMSAGTILGTTHFRLLLSCLGMVFPIRDLAAHKQH
jgi:ubiquinone/menaquinone biosynthesis C-methylase UbiE